MLQSLNSKVNAASQLFSGPAQRHAGCPAARMCRKRQGARALPRITATSLAAGAVFPAVPVDPAVAAAAVAGDVADSKGEDARTSRTRSSSRTLKQHEEEEQQQQAHASTAEASIPHSSSSSGYSHASHSSDLHQAHLSTSNSPPSASLTRLLMMAPTPSLRALTHRKWRMSGPMSFLLLLLGVFLAFLAAVRRLLVKRVKSCRMCRSYGLIRCRLCDGQGSVLWRGKVNHEEMCPLCLTKRYVMCPDCGGHYHRPLFQHRQGNTGRGLIPDFLLKMNG